LEGEAVEVEDGRDFCGQVIGEEISGQFEAGKGLFEEFVVGVADVAQGWRLYRRGGKERRLKKVQALKKVPRT
jgi:hypothetical protein